MISMRRGVKALGLTLLSLVGLMAVSVSGAQGNWLVGGVELAANETVAVQAGGVLKFIVEEKKLEIQCKSLASEGLKLVGKSAIAEGKVKYSACATFSPVGSGMENKNCKLKEPIIDSGTSWKLILHNSKNYLLHEPKWFFDFSELCALSTSTNAGGDVVYECGHLSGSTWVFLDCSTAEARKELRVASSALFPSDKLTFGQWLMIAAGILQFELSGVNAGKSWAGHV